MLISGTFCQILSKLQSLVPAYAISKKKAKQHRCRVRAYSVAKTDAVREVSSPEWVTFSPQTISDATPVWCRSVGKTGEQNDSTRFARSTSNTFVCGAFFSRCDVDFVTEYAVTNFECRAQYHELWTRTFKDDQSRFFSFILIFYRYLHYLPLFISSKTYRSVSRVQQRFGYTLYFGVHNQAQIKLTPWLPLKHPIVSLLFSRSCRAVPLSNH